MITKFFGFISKVVRVNTNTVTADKSRAETKCVPLSIHALNNFVCVDTHAVKYHSKLVHKSNVYITLAVLDNLNRFCGLDIGYRICTNLDNKVIDSFNFFKSFGIATRNNFLDVFKSVNLVSGVNSFGRITNLKINTALQTGLTLNDRQTYIFGYTGINGGLKDYNRAFGQIPTNDFTCTDNGSKIGSVVLINGGRNCNDMEFCLLQIGFDGTKHYACLFDSIVTNFVCRVFTILIKLDLCFVQIKAYNLYTLISKSNRYGHTNITKTDKRKRFLA